jgi:exodeoxyribonuclease VII large subunit
MDDLRNRLEAVLSRVVGERRHALALAAGRLAGVAPGRRVEWESQRLLGLWKRLQAASPASVLNRGFVIVREEGGRPLTRAGALRKGQGIVLEFGDGRGAARVE